MENSYPGSLRLRKNWEYRLVGKMGCKFYTPHFVLLAHKNSSNKVRLGVTVSRRVGNAVKRNRVKRLIREFFRVNKFSFTGNIDYSVIARSGSASLSTGNAKQELTEIFRKASSVIKIDEKSD